MRKQQFKISKKINFMRVKTLIFYNKRVKKHKKI